MRFEGRLWKSGEHWLVEVPALAAMTQGHSRSEAYEMIADSSYARYEQGKAVPTVEKLEELLRAITPEQRLVWRLASS